MNEILTYPEKFVRLFRSQCFGIIKRRGSAISRSACRLGVIGLSFSPFPSLSLPLVRSLLFAPSSVFSLSFCSPNLTDRSCISRARTRKLNRTFFFHNVSVKTPFFLYLSISQYYVQLFRSLDFVLSLTNAFIRYE